MATFAFGARDVAYVDELVKDYLVWRGLTKTLSVFSSELKSDKSKALKANSVVEALLKHVRSFDLHSMLEMWAYLENNFFCLLEESCAYTVQKLEVSLKRYYVVHAIASGNMQHARAFFNMLGPQLCGDARWKPWFSILFMPQPQNSPEFRLFFSRKWVDNFVTSLTNFVHTIFSNIPPPKILNFASVKEQKRQLLSKITTLQSKVQELKQQLQQQQQQQQRFPLKPPQLHLGAATAIGGGAVVAGAGNASPRLGKGRLSPRGATDSGDAAAASSASAEGTAGRPDGWKSITASRYARSRQPGEAHTNSEYKWEVKQEIFSGHTAPVVKVKCSHNGRFIASGSSDGTVRIWGEDPVTSPNGSLFCYSPIRCLTWAPNDSVVLCGGSDGKCHLWSMQKHAVTGNIELPLPFVEDIAFRANSNNFVAISNAVAQPTLADTNSHLRYYSLSRPDKPLRTLKLEVPTSATCSAFTDDGKLLIVGGSDGILRVYDTNEWITVRGWQVSGARIVSLEMCASNNSVRCMDAQGELSEWSLDQAGLCLSRIALRTAARLSGKGAASPRAAAFSSGFAANSSGQYVVYGIGNKLEVLDVAEQCFVQALPGHTAQVLDVDWKPDSNTVLSASADKTIRISRLEERKT